MVKASGASAARSFQDRHFFRGACRNSAADAGQGLTAHVISRSGG